MSNSTLTVKIKTLTPLWTGGVDSTMDRIHETGIIGSLRWWYEAIVRGLGGSACDPTSDSRCPDRDGNYCDACAVFGATGLQRAFRLEGPEWWYQTRENTLKVWVKNNKGWFLGRGFMSEGEMQIVPLRLPEGWETGDLRQSLYLTMKLIECWGGLGPKTQQGYGVVKLEFNQGENVEQAIEAIQRLQNREKQRNISRHHKNKEKNKWPSLEGLFFAKVRFSTGNQNPKAWIDGWRKYVKATFKDEDELNWYLNQAKAGKQGGVLPIASIVRYYLRRLIKRAKDKNGEWAFTHQARHNLMGELGHGSLIHVSHAYPVREQWEFRIWGWIPDGLPGGISRSDVVDNLRNWLGISHQRQWHPAQNGQLWDDVHIPNPEVCWFEQADESTEDYLKALLQCDCDGEIGGTYA